MTAPFFAYEAGLSTRWEVEIMPRLVAEHKIDRAEAELIARELAYGLVKKAYRL